MGFLEHFKNKAANKVERANAENAKNEIYSSWNNLIQEYSAGVVGNGFDYMYRMSNGENNIIGGVKKTSDPNGKSGVYEFLFVYPQPDGQVLSNYFRMTPMGSFESDRSLGNIKIEYVTNVKGTDIPCTATFQTSTQELLNVQDMPLSPQIVPGIKSIDPKLCMPFGNEFTEMFKEFCFRENLTEKYSESMADFTPGR